MEFILHVSEIKPNKKNKYQQGEENKIKAW